MTVQDLVIGGVAIVFILCLLPTVFSRKAVVPITTSSVTAAGLYVMAATYFTLGLWFTTICTVVMATIWVAVLVLRRPKTRIVETPHDG